MTVDTTTQPVPVDHGHGTNDETHIICTACDPDIALCGTDRTGRGFLPEGTEISCVVCLDLDNHPCPRCGL